MAASKYDIIIEQGATFNLPVQVSQSSGVPMNLTGYTKRGQVRKDYYSPDALANFSFSGSLDISGSFSLYLTNTETAAIPAVMGVYDVEIESASGTVTRLLEGKATIKPNVTR